jgi:hypothetical protein
MSEKPSYLGLLNAVAVAERQAAEYLNCWAATTKDPGVRKTLQTIALREAEHGMAFAKRIDELGYEVIDKPDPTQSAKLKTAMSKKLTDREKFELLRLTVAPQNGTRDIFDGFLENKDLDPVTGGLIGRYVAEERDSGRLFAACYASLCAPRNGSAKDAKKGSKNGSKKGSAKEDSRRRKR